MRRLCISPFVIFSFLTQTCKTADQPHEPESESSEEVSHTNEETVDTYPHPKAASAWETQSLILTGKLPGGTDLANCETEVVALSNDATNDDRLLEVEREMEKTVTANPELYHWCFYWMMRNLDIRADQSGLAGDDRNRLFSSGMRGLWALGRALDRARGVNRYFPYLRVRYMQLSQDFFGRKLEVLASPLGSSQGRLENEDGRKPAGESSND